MTSHKYDVIYQIVMADGAFPMTRNEQVTYVNIKARWGKSAIEIQKGLEEVGSEFIIPYTVKPGHPATSIQREPPLSVQILVLLIAFTLN